jgi:hypothetical protein
LTKYELKTCQFQELLFRYPPPGSADWLRPARQLACRRTPTSLLRNLGTSSWMSPIRDFVAGLAKAGKTLKEIRRQLKLPSQIFVKEDSDLRNHQGCEGGERQSNRKRKVRSPDIVTEIAAEVEIDRRTTIQRLAAAHGVCMRTIQLTYTRTWTCQRSLQGGPSY